ncbi:MAG TPA: transposase [Myxococcales bacterium LLY-WYZ-16_1]|nr:transposase [Myxococcales bacterium LLY-WYZ-16_1]
MSSISDVHTALNLHAHFHVLATDGRWREDASGVLRFQDFPPKFSHIESVSQRVADRIIALLRRWGRLEDEHLEWMDAPTSPLPVADGEAGWLVGEDQPLVAPSTVAPVGTPNSAWVAQTHGFSVHAGISIEGFDVRGRERLCRYVTRAPYADAQLTETRDGRIAYKLAKPKRTGETHVFFTPHQLVRRLTSQIPPPGQNLLRYHGILGPAARRRKEVVRSAPPRRAHGQEGDSEALNEKAATWATLLHRVYEIDVLDCPDCGGRLRIVSAIEDPPVIRKDPKSSRRRVVSAPEIEQPRGRRGVRGRRRLTSSARLRQPEPSACDHQGAYAPVRPSDPYPSPGIPALE